MELCDAVEIMRATTNRPDPDTVKLDWPTRWAPFIFNGDSSGLNESEALACSEALALIAYQGLTVVDVEDESHFSWFQGFGSELSTYTAIPR